MTTETIWKDIPGYEGLYKVSNDGQVLSLERTCMAARLRRVRQRLLKPTVKRESGKIRSFCVKLSCPDNGQMHSTVGRLVLLAFVGPYENGVAHYKDSNPLNNHIENLEWSTFRKIAEEKVNGGYHPPRYSKHWAKEDRE